MYPVIPDTSQGTISIAVPPLVALFLQVPAVCTKRSAPGHMRVACLKMPLIPDDNGITVPLRGHSELVFPYLPCKALSADRPLSVRFG